MNSRALLLATMLGCSLSSGLPGPVALGADAPKSAQPRPPGPWTPLFDGRTTAGWRGFGKAAFPEKGWIVKDGWLTHVAQGGGGDLVTEREDIDLSSIVPGRPDHLHIQAVCKVTVSIGEETQVGTGILEQFIIGAYAPLGLTSLAAD